MNNNTFGWELLSLGLAVLGLGSLGGSALVMANKSPATWARVASTLSRIRLS